MAAAAAEDVEAIIRQANDLRKGGDDQGALPLLLRAYQLDPSPRTAIQLGLVEWAIGRWADADRHLTEGLKAPDHPFIRKNRETIVSALRVAKEKIGSLDIQGEPAGAEVLVNGVVVGKLPMAKLVVVNAGSADVEVRAQGYRQEARTVSVSPQHVQAVVIRLSSPADPAGARRAAAGSPVLPRPPGPATDPVHDQAIRPGGGNATWRWLKLGATGAAAVAVGVAGYGFFIHEQKVAEFRDRTDSTNRGRCLESGSSVVDADGRRAMPDCFDLRSQYRNARAVMFGGLISGAAFGRSPGAVAHRAGDRRPAGRPANGEGTVGLCPGAPWSVGSLPDRLLISARGGGVGPGRAFGGGGAGSALRKR